MFCYKTTILGAFLTASLAATAFAQDSAAPADTMAPADCGAQFTALDTDADGYLSDVEAPREYARFRVDEITVADKGISKDEFLKQCGEARWSTNMPEVGAPLEGANSFTEDQAHDRAISWNVTDVSVLVLDDVRHQRPWNSLV